MLSFYLLNAEIKESILLRTQNLSLRVPKKKIATSKPRKEEKYFENNYNDSRLLMEKVYGCPKVKKAEEKSLTSHRVRAEK